MRRAIKVSVSTGRDLARERDVIGRAVAELPVTAGCEIGATPLGGQVNDLRANEMPHTPASAYASPR